MGNKLYPDIYGGNLARLRIRMLKKNHEVQKVMLRNLPNKLVNKELVMVNMGLVMLRSLLKLPVRHQRHPNQLSKGPRSSMLRCMACMLVLSLRSYSKKLMRVLKGGLVTA